MLAVHFRFGLSIVAFAISLVFLGQWMRTARWTEIRPAGEGFSVALPGEPGRTVLNGGHEVVYEGVLPGARYAVAVQDVDDVIAKMDTYEIYILASSGQPEGVVRRDVTVGSMRGRELDWRTGSKTIKVRFFVAGQRVYLLRILSGSERVERASRDTKRFFESFSLLEDRAALAK